MQEAKVLIYRIEDKDKLNSLLKIFKSKDIECKEINEDDAFQRVGYLIGLDGYRKIENEDRKRKASKSEMLLFAHIDDEKMLEILKEMKDKKIYVPLKAGLTETNSNWILNDLIFHIEGENLMMQAYTSLLKDVNGIDLTIEKKSPDLVKLLNEAKTLANRSDLTIRDVEEYNIKVLREYREYVDDKETLSLIDSKIERIERNLGDI